VARQLSPCIIFFDQLDALVPKRGSDSGSRTTERVVNQILSELDGIKALSNILVIGATNRLDLVDSSVLRPGRLGTRIFVPLPNGDDRADILRIYLKDAMLDQKQDAQKLIRNLAVATDGFSGAELQALCEEAKLRAYSDDQRLSKQHFEMVIEQFRNVGPASGASAQP
jgi:transitional endoplasmic reticulum ATPase